MADMVTAQELENAKIDARTIGESVNENKIVTPRYGAPFKSMPMIAEEMQSVIGTIIAGGVPASIVADESGKSQQDVNNGIESIADLITISNPKDGNRQYVKSYHAGLNRGGDDFYFDSTKVLINDGAFIFNGWIRIVSIINQYTFGCKGNDTDDDTVAVQRMVDYSCDKHVIIQASSGVHKITDKINFKCTFGWGIVGAGQSATIFKQYTDNIPVFDLGSIPKDYMHSYVLEDFSFDYSTIQPATNKKANPLYFSEMGFEGTLNRVTFSKGSWAIGVKSGVGGPWGQSWDNLNFGGGLTGGAMDWTGAVNSVPNNVWGRFLVTATNMVGPIFKQIKGYNWTLGCLEILNGKNVQWIDAQAGAELTITALKLELATYNDSFIGVAGEAVMYFPSGLIEIGQLNIGGTYATFEFTSFDRYLVNAANGACNIKMFKNGLTKAPTRFYMYSLNMGESFLNIPKKGVFPIPYTNIGGSLSANFLKVTPDFNDKLSDSKGDADYSIALGDPCNVDFATILTAPRVVNLPPDSLFNGLKYRIMSHGAVNGANTITIKANSITKHVLSTDKSFVDLVWRRNATPHSGWVVVGSGVIP